MRFQSLVYSAINTPVRALLRSPLHGIASGNLCILHHRGRRSGRHFEIPLSYTRDQETRDQKTQSLHAGARIRLLSSHNTRWWMNLLDGPTPVEIEIARERYPGLARVRTEDDDVFRDGIRAFLTALPRDARVYGIGLDGDRRPRESDIESAAGHVVLIEIELTG